MRIRWRGFELPTRVVCDEETLTDSYGKFTAEPFEYGYGTTIGNSLRRVLLSSLEGSAVTSVKFDSVKHEFTSIPGVLEDVTDIILNIKNLIVKLHVDEPKVIKIDAHQKGEVVAGDIITDANVEIVNKDLHIAELTEDVDFVAEMTVKKGRGYITAEENEEENQEIGVIPIDSIFSPVRRVKYETVNTRVGQKTNYDKLIMEVWTDGTVTPEMAIVEASKILRKHLNPFVQYFEIGRELQQEEAERDQAKQLLIDSAELDAKLDSPVSELDLSVRASNCLDMAGIKTIRELVDKTEAEMLEIRNFGKTSLKEVKKKLSDMGLALGMFVDENSNEEEEK